MLVFAWFTVERGSYNNRTRANTRRPLGGSGLGGLLYCWGLIHPLDTSGLQPRSAAIFGGSEYPLLQCLVSGLKVTFPCVPRVEADFHWPVPALVFALNQTLPLQISQRPLDVTLRSAQRLG